MSFRGCIPASWIALVLSAQASAALPSFEDVRARDESSEIVLLDRAGQLLDSYRLNPRVRKAPWVRLEEFSPLVRKLLIEMEDRRFFDHEGVDWWALGKSALQLLRGRDPGDGRARGASTLTMQLVSLIDPARERKGRRSVAEKWDQVRAALELERSWTKNQILEAYLNLVPLRGEWVGVHSVAQFLMRKLPAALDPAEAAILVAMLPSPNQPWPRLIERACVFLRSAYAAEPAQAQEFCQAVRSRVAGFERELSATDRMFEHYTRYFVGRLPERDRKGGIKKTSLDRALQRKVYEYAKESLLTISSKNVSEIAALVLDHRTGEWLAYLGNIQGRSKAAHVDGVQARRQAGSTLKPFFYGLALQNRKFDLQSRILDEPIQVQTGNGAYRPENYDHEFHGWVTLPVALASSLNIPAIKVVQEAGVEASVGLLPRLGIGEVKAPYIYGPSIALGSADVTLEELTRAYAALARQAMGVTDSKFPLSAPAARSITRVLTDNTSRSLTFGMNSVLATPYFTAVKTGTSKDMRDNWCVGYSDRYAVGVWVGNFSGTPMTDVSGVSGAAPLWRKIMDKLNAQSPSVMPAPIAAIELPEPVCEPASERQRERAALAAHPSTPKIVYPNSGSVLAVDPEIPADRQKVLLKVSTREKGYRWKLNGRELGSIAEPLLWLLERGKMLLEIQTDDGKVVDSVRFIVK